MKKSNLDINLGSESGSATLTDTVKYNCCNQDFSQGEDRVHMHFLDRKVSRSIAPKL